ncbi:MAG: hypothetical protein IKN77_01455 [Paludibacteraceae bacterium]|nr:hypothetical protein [Paludibacteraceae bacterium]
MKARIFWLSFVALLLLNAGVVDVSAQKVFKGIILRSQEKVEYTSTEWVEVELPETDDSVEEDSIGSVVESIDLETGDSKNGVSYMSQEVKKLAYEVFSLSVQMDFSVEAYPYRNNPYLQEDIVKYIVREKQYADSLEKVMHGYMRGAKSLDDMVKRLKKVKKYDKFVYDDLRSFAIEVDTLKKMGCRKHGGVYPVKIDVKNGVLYMVEGHDVSSPKKMGLYDVETGKRIEPEDLLTTLQFVGRYNDTIKINAVTRIDGECIDFYYNDKDWYVYSVYKDKDSSLLTPYAKSLMAKDKGYRSTTRTNEFGDQIQIIEVNKVNERYESRKVQLPVQLNGCKNTQKVRNRMLEVMFGRSDGNLENLVTEGVQKWIPEYGRGSQMLLFVGDGVVSFGFEDLSAYANDRNTFIVFDKTTGDEIDVKDLIKDKKGFLDYVNSFNMYFAGFLFDSTNVERGTKVGENLRSYLKHSGGYLAPFNGWDELPTSWWFAFSKMDEFIPVEFNTKDSRIFLNYDDVKAFIDPKYHEMLDRAVKSIRR